uniref:Retrotransposon protein, putative, unclassified n=1 Tax=Oryza sativa subsp. japonica TaxID=39947 RepID=Q339R5_ORYSJ|nr:retrotransposon protein, putative, unclassified [Oryza sativa Japonica Group]
MAATASDGDGGGGVAAQPEFGRRRRRMVSRGDGSTGRRTHPKWVTKLGQFDVHFIPRTTIKSQVLSDFVANWTVAEDGKVGHTNNERSTMAFNGAFSIQGAGVGFILTSLKGDQF